VIFVEVKHQFFHLLLEDQGKAVVSRLRAGMVARLPVAVETAVGIA
jgi:hypothetical protein